MKPSDVSTFQPRLKVLNGEQAQAIHTAALEILEKTGFKMEHGRALEMLAAAGASVTEADWASTDSGKRAGARVPCPLALSQSD